MPFLRRSLLLDREGQRLERLAAEAHADKIDPGSFRAGAREIRGKKQLSATIEQGEVIAWMGNGHLVQSFPGYVYRGVACEG